MNDLELTLEPDYTQSLLHDDDDDDKPLTFADVYQYILDVLKAIDPIPESDNAQEVPEITDEEIDRYYE